MKVFTVHPLVTVLLGAASLSIARGQGFNIDLDVFGGGPPEIGNGAPSDTFGAAANQPGRWNRIYTVDHRVLPLVDLTGEPTHVSYQCVSASGEHDGGGNNIPANTGDYALLLNDARVVGPAVNGNTLTFKFAGLLSGIYDVTTYAVSITGGTTSCPIVVPGSSTPNPQVVTGPMPSNQLLYGVTHAIHRVSVADEDELNVIIAQQPGTFPPYWINGFQIKPVPETAPGLVVLAGLLLLAYGRRA